MLDCFMFFILMLGILLILNIIFHKHNEKHIVRAIILSILWSILFTLKLSNLLYFVGTVTTMLFTDLFLISKFYPTNSTIYFFKGRKNAVQRNIPREEEHIEDSKPNKSDDIPKDS